MYTGPRRMPASPNHILMPRTCCASYSVGITSSCNSRLYIMPTVSFFQPWCSAAYSVRVEYQFHVTPSSSSTAISTMHRGSRLMPLRKPSGLFVGW